MSFKFKNHFYTKKYIKVLVYNIFACCIFVAAVAVRPKEMNVIKYMYVYFSKAGIKCVRLASFKHQNCFHNIKSALHTNHDHS